MTTLPPLATPSLDPALSSATGSTLVAGDDLDARALSEAMRRAGWRVGRIPLRAAGDQAVARAVDRVDRIGRLDRLVVCGGPGQARPVHDLLGAALPYLRDARGSIVFVTGGRRRPTEPWRDQVTALARDLGYFGVRVNLLHLSPAASRLDACLAEPVELDDVVRAVLLLTSTRGITGQVLLLDGGASLSD